ncbi:protein sprint isoform X5 [Dermatophagoides farinae]
MQQQQQFQFIDQNTESSSSSSDKNIFNVIIINNEQQQRQQQQSPPSPPSPFANRTQQKHCIIQQQSATSSPAPAPTPPEPYNDYQIDNRQKQQQPKNKNKNNIELSDHHQQVIINQRNHQHRKSPIIINNNNNNNNKIHSLIQQFNNNNNNSLNALDKETLSMTTETSELTKPNIVVKQMSLSHNKNNDNDDRKSDDNYDQHENDTTTATTVDVLALLPEGNVDDDDELDHEEEDDDDDDDDDDGREIAYEVDADDEQSNDMLDDNTDDEEEDEDDDGPKSTSPGPVAAGSIVTKIDPSTKSMVQVISIMKNHSHSHQQKNQNQQQQQQQPKTITSFINQKMLKDEIMRPAESEDSAADVSYERTSDLAESDDLEGEEEEEDATTTTLTTVDTNNVNNLDSVKELSYDQRFRMTQTIWYLPHINRATVVHYLQGKNVGVFIVRQSSKPNTMAVSVRLPQGRGPHVEHYLIEKITKAPVSSSTTKSSSTSSVFRLEGSEHYFNSILQLVIHYSQCQDELPVQLNLPSVLLNSGRSQLTSLALLGQEFWQSKFVSLKQLPKNSLNNETLAMINQNQNQQQEPPPQQQQQQQPTKHYNRQKARRHNSNSSESNQSKSSMSMSPMPPPSISIRSRRNTSDSASPTTMPSQSNAVSPTPPPLPPKNLSMTCGGDHQSNSPLMMINPTKTINEDSISSPITATANTTTIVEVHNNPTIKNHNHQNNLPKLPPRIPNYVPPPIPPRNRNSPNGGGSTTPPPLPANGPPLSSLRTKKPYQSNQQSKPAALQDLLSPMSMTESEIEMAKFSLTHKITPNILEVEEYNDDDDEISNNLSLQYRNYYNQMIQAPQHHHTSSLSPVPIMIGEEEIKNQQTPSPAPLPPQHSLAAVTELQPSIDAQQPPPPPSSSIKCDVCTQTYDTNKQLLLTPNQSQMGRITRANSSLSCFYMDPIDALVAIHQQHQQPKRHSDPELASNSQNTMDMESSSLNPTTFTMSHSLESLLENFRNRFATAVSGSDLNSIRETLMNERRNQFIHHHHHQQQNQGLKSFNPKHDTAFSTLDSAWQWHSGIGGGDQCHHNGRIHRSIQNQLAMKMSLAQLEHLKRSSITTNGSMKSDITTVEDLISAKAPELAVPKITHIDSMNLINKKHRQQQQPLQQDSSDRERKLTAKSVATDVCTEFSEPWNMDVVESLFISELHHGGGQSSTNHCGLDLDDDDSTNSTRQLLNNDLINFNSFLLNQEQHPHGLVVPQTNEDDYDSVAEDESDEQTLNGHFIKRDDSEITLKEKNPQQPRNSSSSTDDGIKLNIAYNISNYVFELAARKDNTFAKSIDNFIECTKETTDPNPSVILGYVRQFMNGMKNYLIKHGEGDFIKIVQNERSRLKPNQFLNIDSILEVSLQKLIIKPLKNFLYELFIRSHTMSGSLKILSTNIKLAQNKTPEELGIRTELLPIDPRIMAEIQKNLRRLQQSYSPIKKLEHLLRCIAILNGNYKEKITSKCSSDKQSKYNRAFSGDDLLPMLVYLIVHCGVISAEIESEYMLGLLHPSILNGEGSYYLTVLSSAIQVLKTMYTADNARALEDIITLNGVGGGGQSMFSMLKAQPSENLQRQMNSSTTNGGGAMISSGSTCAPLALPSIANMQAYMKIMIPNELTSSITCKTVPVRHNMTTKEVCRMIAHTFRITNPEDYSLYRIKENGLEEIQLLDNEYPQVIKSELMARNESTMFAYKRCDAKFIWPITSPN